MLGKLCPLVLVVAICCGAQVGAAEITPYLTASDGKPSTNAGLRVNDGVLSIHADLAVNSESAVTRALPQVSSELALAEWIGFATSVKLPDWNGAAGQAGAIFDTRVHFEPGAPFIDRIEGRLRRDPDGLERQSLKLGFSDALGWVDGAGNVAVKGSAIIEGKTEPGSDGSLTMGFEASLDGFDVPALGLGDLGLRQPSGRRITSETRKRTNRDQHEEDELSSSHFLCSSLLLALDKGQQSFPSDNIHLFSISVIKGWSSTAKIPRRAGKAYLS